MTKEYKIELDDSIFNELQKLSIETSELKNLLSFMVEHHMMEHPKFFEYSKNLREKTEDYTNKKNYFTKYIQTNICKQNQTLISWNLQFEYNLLKYTVKEED